MQQVVFDTPYEFVPAFRSPLWSASLQVFLKTYLRKSYGIVNVECRGVESLRRSLEQDCGIILAPNHSRLADPLVLGILSRQSRSPFYAMASWHLFMQGWFQKCMIRCCGAFSVFREGTDRTALDRAIEVISTAERPLVIFPEGALSRSNDHIGPLADGTAFVARNAAKKRAKQKHPGGGVVVHPVILKYLFRGDIQATGDRILRGIEQRLSWEPQDHLPLLARVHRVGQGLLALKEIEFMGQAQTGRISHRLPELMEYILRPLEREWTDGPTEGTVVNRVRRLRSAILPEMVRGEVSEQESRRRWKQLNAAYVAQQLSLYQPGYITANPTPERILETLEGFEEDLTDTISAHPPVEVVIQVGEAIKVSTERVRGRPDPLMVELQQSMQAILEKLMAESGAPLPLPDEATLGRKTKEGVRLEA